MDQRYRLSEFDRRRQEELQRANLPAFWIVFFLIIAAVTLCLVM